MKIPLILFTLLGYSSAKRATCQACLNSVCYRREKIVERIKFSGQLAIDRTSNILYFHYQNQSLDFTGAFDLDNVRLKNIHNNEFSFGLAVDQATKDLYLTGVLGLYRYNPLENKTELYGLKDKTLWHLQYEDKLYYSEFRKKGIYTYEGKKPRLIPGTDYQIDNFIIDRYGDIYFMHNFSIYLLANGGKTAELFEDEIYSLTTDKNGNAYFIQPFTRAVYKMVHRYKRRYLKEIGAFRNGSAFIVIFDGDNDIIYYDGTDKLHYLAPTANRCSVTTIGFGRKVHKFISTG